MYRNSLYLDTLASVFAHQTNLPLNSPEDYRKAINQLLDQVELKTFSIKAQTAILKGLGLLQKAERLILKEMITGKKRNRLIAQEAEILQQKIFVYLPDKLEELLKNESGETAGILRSFAVKIRSKDPFTQAALFNEIFQQKLLEVGLSKPDEKDWYARMAAMFIVQVLIPGLEDHNVKVLTPQLLDNLEKWGLLKPARPGLFIHSSNWQAERLGKAYQDNVWGWKSEPKRTDVTTTPYEMRLREWKLGRQEYEDQRSKLALRMAKFAQDFGLGENAQLNEARLIRAARSGELAEILTEVLENRFTKDILAYKTAPNFSMFSTREITAEEITSIKNAIEVIRMLLRFASENPEGKVDILADLAESFYQIVLGLYVLEEAK